MNKEKFVKWIKKKDVGSNLLVALPVIVFYVIEFTAGR